VPISKYSVPGEETHVTQPLSCWPNTTTVRTVPARNWTFSRPPRRRMDHSGADERVPDQSGIPKTSSDDDDDH
jgi:hypothetical protein